MRIGYYAHHHGSGHCRQADKLAALLPPKLRSQMTVFTSLPNDGYHFSAITDEQIVRLSAEDQLPEDVLLGRAGKYWQPSSLHYSPVGNRNVQMRSWQLLDEIRQRQIDLMIIDVSAEVAMLCRAASVPYLYVRLAGERDDMPHLNAFAGALGLLTPYPKALEAAATPDWVCQKTLYLDFMPNKTNELLTFAAFINKLTTLTTDKTIHERLHSRLDAVDKSAEGNAKDNANEGNANEGNIVTVIKGYGGHDAIDAKLPELRRALPNALIISLGPINDEARHCVDIAAHVNDVTPFIAYSDLLLMACGLNGIAQAYDYATPLVVLPDERPHREQEVMAEALIEQGRALSWAQFMAQNSSLGSQDIPSFLSVNNKSISNESINTDKTALTDNQDNTPAQKFMDSIVDYTSVKAWFEEWLLPQLGLKPER
ncbi:MULTISPECIES: hypothetical protein [Psychrobacter]|uniref:hypothetical protein n=1 Tax=Psychrobacter TaxID=497 RepID=UPI000C3409B2|nr:MULTISPECIES: hypothetical protein [Psychrobacter]PKG34544.1 hypothetical protein CXF65_13430 [Psychrobacter sp. Sarcosine-3u-12]